MYVIFYVCIIILFNYFCSHIYLFLIFPYLFNNVFPHLFFIYILINLINVNFGGDGPPQLSVI